VEDRRLTKKKRKLTKKITSKLEVSSKFWKEFLIILAAFFTFAGPTYIVFVLINILSINYFLSMFLGIILLISGLAIIWYLVKSDIIS
jgi:capsule polysaccharide export protein KpsE/RkpR